MHTRLDSLQEILASLIQVKKHYRDKMEAFSKTPLSTAIRNIEEIIEIEKKVMEENGELVTDE